ncbi:hypothetical protein Tco_1182066 [Tanacetum coccineum]
MSTREQHTPTIPTSAVRNTGGRSGPQGLEEPTSDEVLRELCDKNYHQLLPLITEKMQKEKEQQYKLNAKVIENGNSWVPIPETTPPESGTSTTIKMTVPTTIEEKTCKKNDVKARSLLLMALPNEHQLTFDQYVDAQ